MICSAHAILTVAARQINDSILQLGVVALLKPIVVGTQLVRRQIVPQVGAAFLQRKDGENKCSETSLGDVRSNKTKSRSKHQTNL